MRTRQIKPAYFSCDELGAIPLEAQYLLAGLACMANDEQEIKYRPRFIRHAVFPYEPHLDAKIESWVASLESIGVVSLDRVRNVLTIDEWDEYFVRERASIPGWSKIRRLVFERDNYTCKYCGVEDLKSPHCDHVVPVSQGGSSKMDNLTTSCRSCNNSKHAKTPEQWAARRTTQ